MISSNLLQNKSSVSNLDAYGYSLRTFVPEFQICPPRGAFDTYGRDAPPQSIDTQTCPGGFTPLARIEVENSLRPFISPLYFNLPIGISGGADTMFGRVNINRPNGFGNRDEISVPLTNTDDSFAGARNTDSVSSLYTSMAAKYNGNVGIAPDFDTYGFNEGGIQKRYGGYVSEPDVETYRYKLGDKGEYYRYV